MNLSPPRFSTSFRRGVRCRAAAPAPVDDSDALEMMVRERDDERADGDPPEPGWRGSSYDLKHGLDVVELPTSLPVDVLDRLVNAPAK